MFTSQRVFYILVGLTAFVVGFGIAFALPQSLMWQAESKMSSESDGGESESAGFACPMFCVVMKEKPADEKCPVCGMELGEISRELVVDEQERSMIGLEVARIETRSLERRLSIWGEITYDEQGLNTVSARSAGWITQLEAKQTWQEVKAGDILAKIDAPEATSTLEELLVARRSGSKSLEEAQRERLELLGVDAVDIKKTLELGKAPRLTALRAPQKGTLVRRRITEGEYVKKGQSLFLVANLDRVWFELEVFEPDAPLLRRNGRVLLDRGDGSALIGASIDWIDPILDTQSRVLRARIELENLADAKGNRPFRIGQRLEATLLVAIDATGAPNPDLEAPEDVLALPRDAVLSTGKRKVAFVMTSSRQEQTASGRTFQRTVRELNSDRLPMRVGYELIELDLGPLSYEIGAQVRREFYPVRAARWVIEDGPSQLKEGWVVATKGALMLDAQAQLAGSPSLFFPQGSETSSSDPHAGH
ncbi:MAG: efflux RND transporter periplasmic adaptor subunit [Planctomycetota bacterium]